MRSGGDAGTAIHTSVPFGIAATMDAVSIHCGEDIGRRRVRRFRRIGGNWFSGLSSGMKLSRQAARSMH